jgi:predicted nicotinamide N-methyase
MPPGVGRALARAYRLTTRPPDPSADEAVEVRPGVTAPRFVLEWSQSGLEEARALLAHFPTFVEPEAKSVLAIGRGAGDLGLEVAHRGARRVVAVDMALRRMRLSAIKLEERGPLPVEIKPFTGTLSGLGDERFDLAIAADAFRSYGASPSSRHLEVLIDELARRLEHGGLLALRFGPPWKAPFGGDGDSRLPWAHLLFPETVIFDEFRRVRRGSEARSFEDIGINRVSLARFRQAMRESDLECLYFASNVGKSRAVAALRMLSRIKPLEEYFTQNVYGVWRRP